MQWYWRGRKPSRLALTCYGNSYGTSANLLAGTTKILSEHAFLSQEAWAMLRLMECADEDGLDSNGALSYVSTPSSQQEASRKAMSFKTDVSKRQWRAHKRGSRVSGDFAGLGMVSLVQAHADISMFK